MKHLGYKECITTTPQVGVCTMLMDGGLLWFSIDINGGDIVYWVSPKYWDLSINGKLKNEPRYKFQFQFAKVSGGPNNVTNSILILNLIFIGGMVLKKDWKVVRGLVYLIALIAGIVQNVFR